MRLAQKHFKALAGKEVYFLTKDDEIDERDVVELTDDVWECLIPFIDYVTVEGRNIVHDAVVGKQSKADKGQEIWDQLNTMLSAAPNADSAPQPAASSSQSKLVLVRIMENLCRSRLVQANKNLFWRSTMEDTKTHHRSKLRVLRRASGIVFVVLSRQRAPRSICLANIV